VKRSLLLLAGVAGAVFALDRWTKHWASHALPFNQPVPVLGEFFRLTYTRNSGVAFGLGAGTGFPYYIFSIIAAFAILWLFLRHRHQSLPRQLALALILGGAIGNLVDRVRSGEVVDFVEIGFRHWYWPVFNVADSAVTVGVILFALTWSHRTDEGAGLAPAAPGDGPTLRGATPDERSAGVLGAGGERGGAVGPLPGGGADRPVA